MRGQLFLRAFQGGHGSQVPQVVIIDSSGPTTASVASQVSYDAVRTVLVPQATVVTPNLDEIRLITGIEVVDDPTARRAAEALHALGAQWAIVKGGHLRTSPDSTDLLFDGDRFLEFTSPRIDTGNDHGGGDTLAAAIASALAHGWSVPDAVAFAKEWVTKCLEWSYDLGGGHGPVNPLWRLQA